MSRFYRLFVVWNINAIVFLSFFCFLVIVVLWILVLFMLLLVTVIRFSLLFFMLSSCRLIDVSTLCSMLLSPPPLSFLDIYSLSISSLGSTAISIVMNFLVLFSICCSSVLCHFKNGPEYLTRRTAEVFIPLIKFLQNSLISSSFFVLPGYSF